MNSEDIKAYVQFQLLRMERLIPTERTASFYEEQRALYQLWLQAQQAEMLQRIATVLDNWYQNGVPIENVGGH